LACSKLIALGLLNEQRKGCVEWFWMKANNG
jgi:hypothetical protein